MALRRWPKVKNRVGFLARGDIKRASVGEVERLSRQAALNHWSGQGRPAWLDSHCGEIADIYVTSLSAEAAGFFRCSVLVVLSDGSGGHFRVDMSPKDFRRLRNVGRKALVEMSHAYIKTFRNIKLDPYQAGKWRR